MARSLLVAPVADHSALARTCLGLLRALDRQGVKVAFVKPVAQPSADGGPDRSAELVAAVTTLRPPEPLSTALLEQQLGEGELEVVLEKIVAAWEPVYGGSDVVVIQGLSPAPSRLYASSLNEALARALDADVVLAGYWPADGDAEGLAEQFAIAASGYVAGEQARVVGCVIHGLPAAGAAAAAGLRAALARRQLSVVAAVPYRPELTWPGSAIWYATCTRGSCTRATCPGASGTWRSSPRAFPAASMPWTPEGWWWCPATGTTSSWPLT